MAIPKTIEQETNGAVAVPVQEPASIEVFGNLVDFVAGQRMAQALASGDIVPKEYRGNVGNCLIALDLYHRLGGSLLGVMQNLFIIYGKPSLSSSYLIASVNSSGKFSPLRFRYQGTPGKDDWGCRAVATCKISGEQCDGPLVDIAMSKKEGWYDRKDKNGKYCSKWRTLPELMLTYRAAAFWIRIYAPELSLGMHTSDEVTDIYVQPVASKTTTLAELTQRDDAAEPTREASSTGMETQQATAMGGSGHANGSEATTAPVSETLFREDDSATEGGVSEIHRELAYEVDSQGMGTQALVSLLNATAKVSRIEDLDEEMAGRVLGILRERKD